MSTRTRLITACLLVFGLGQVDVSQSNGQSNSQDLGLYTQSRLNVIRNQNSMSRFSSQRYQNQAYNSSVPRYNFSRVNRNIFDGLNSAPKRKKSKPFSNIDRGSAVTPYLGLGGLQSGGAPNYYTNVKPRLDQQRQNQQTERRNMAMQQQLNRVAAQAPFNPRGSEAMAPTGHSAVYLNLGGYYPEAR